jgi:cation diffusion facilitator family transporter
MSKHCCHPETQVATDDAAYRRTLWIVLTVNLAMFVAEIIFGIVASSVALQADALDFLGDAANYGIALYALSRTIKFRAYTALAKSASMLAFGIWVMGQAIYKITTGIPPEADIMGIIGFTALAANLFCFYLLSRHNHHDSNRQSAWLCTRNDAIGNVAVLVAAACVYFTASFWPDLIVAAIMATLAIHSAWQVARQARAELRDLADRN